MSLTGRELWAMIHGMGLGSLFLLSYTGGLVGLYTLRPEWATASGIHEKVRRLTGATWVMAIVAWLTVFTGSYIVYPWYRAVPPQGTTGEALTQYPQRFLLADPSQAEWHRFAMEWKEHIAWMAPILATAVAFVVLSYGPKLAHYPRIRQAVMVLFTIGFCTAGIAGLFGALITKAAPVH